MINSILKYLKENILAVIIGIAILLIIILSTILSNDMEEHIEKVSKECASQGYGIKASYTKEGDKFYTCNKDGGFND